MCGRVGAWGAEGGVKAGAAALLWLRLLSLLYYVCIYLLWIYFLWQEDPAV